MKSFASKKFFYIGILSFAIVCLISFCCLGIFHRPAYADNETDDLISEEDPDGYHYVTIFDGEDKVTIRTSAQTVADVLDMAHIVYGENDIIEPGLDEKINIDNFKINIYQSHPVVISDGKKVVHIMTASYDIKTIAKEAGLTIYDGDDVSIVDNVDFLESGIATSYKITRNGGRNITVEEEIPFEEEVIRDYNLASGKQEVRQLGEVGSRTLVYEVQYENNIEVSRQLISDTIVREPVKRIVAIGAKKSVAPEQEICAGWIRAAGVSENDISAALELIYHESGCRVDAANSITGAYGIPQALPGSKMSSAGSDWETNPITQIRWMSGYVTGRYGGWQEAMNFWWSHGWY